MTETTLDATGLKCPLPVLRARKSLKNVAPGEVLRILATDSDAPGDFKSFCETTGHELVECTKSGDTFTILVRKAGS